MSDDINRHFQPDCGAHFLTESPAESPPDLALTFWVVPITSGRDVSDPRTDPGVRVRVPRVGSLTPRLLSCAGYPRGKRRRAIDYRY